MGGGNTKGQGLGADVRKGVGEAKWSKVLVCLLISAADRNYVAVFSAG